MSIFNPELRENRESKFEENKFSPDLAQRLLKALDGGKEKYPDIVQCPNRSCGNPLKIEMRADSIYVYCTNCGWDHLLSRNRVISEGATKYEWHTASDWQGLDPIVQVHGVCFDDAGKILIIREPGKEWHLVGGKPEAGESFEQTLLREVKEETNVDLADSQMIGFQKVTRGDGSIAYQLRFAAIIKNTEPERPDPTTGLTNERLFVNPAEIRQYISYKEIFEIVAAATRWFNARQLQ